MTQTKYFFLEGESPTCNTETIYEAQFTKVSRNVEAELKVVFGYEKMVKMERSLLKDWDVEFHRILGKLYTLFFYRQHFFKLKLRKVEIEKKFTKS